MGVKNEKRCQIEKRKKNCRHKIWVSNRKNKKEKKNGIHVCRSSSSSCASLPFDTAVRCAGSCASPLRGRVAAIRRCWSLLGAAVLCCVLCCAFVATVCCAGRCAFAIEYQIGLCRVSPTPTAQKKKNCYFAFLAIPPWLWRPPYATRNATAIQWHFFKFSSRYSAMAAI